MEKVRSFILGLLLSLTTWEAWQNVILSLVVAFLGGFAAASGRHLHKKFLAWKERRAESGEKGDGRRETGDGRKETGNWRKEEGNEN